MNSLGAGRNNWVTPPPASLPRIAYLLLVAALLLGSLAGNAQAAHPKNLVAETNSPTHGEWEVDLLIGGVGGVYFLAEPGELVVDIVKRDLNRRQVRTELRAILAGPDRRVLQEAVIPDDGQPPGSGLGPAQACRLTARVDRRGVYALNITVSQDRYGQEAVWGFRSNSRKYLIETARGHKDEPHQEPIQLASPGRAGNVCFLPRPDAFRVELAGLPKGAAAPQMFDARNTLIAALPVDESGQASHDFTAGVHRDSVPWRLHFPSAQATVNLDGVTRWEANDLHRDLACWTPDPSSWFPLLENRWLLTPYSRTIYGQANERVEIAFQVHNDASRARAIQLQLEFPDGRWPVRLSAERVTLGGKQAATVTVACTVPAVEAIGVCRVRATPLDDSGFSTYSTITVKAGVAPAAQPLTIPIQLKPYDHENEQFGYLPDYPTESQVYFDVRNRPFIRTRGGISTWRGDQWASSEPGDYPGVASSKVAFDRDNHIYLLATTGRTAALLYSTDGGATFTAGTVPGRAGQSSAFDIEAFTGHNVPDGPPPILRYTRTANDEQLFWRSLNDLELFLSKKVDGRLVLGEPILISRQCIGQSSHSGIPASVVSRGSKVHVVWGEATDPKVKVAGVPAYVATYDRESERLSPPALVGYGAPPNDRHNSPSITMDGQGYLHVLAGTHGRPFPYARSLQPNDAGGGWTKPQPADENARQTYVGLVCGPDDTLHSVFRLWQSGVEPFPGSTFATLAYQRKRPGQPWEPPRVLILPAFSEYSVFYHRLTLDRKGRLFLSYDYWSTYWFYRNDHVGRRRALLMSPDGGDTWKMAETQDMIGKKLDGFRLADQPPAGKPAREKSEAPPR